MGGVPLSTMKNVAGAVWSFRETFADRHPKTGIGAFEHITNLAVGYVSAMLLKWCA